MHVSAIIAAGGRGVRFGGSRPKQFLMVGGQSILQRTVEAFLRCDRIADIVVALPKEVADDPPDYLGHQAKSIEVVAGGDRRQDSVANAFARVAGRADVVVIHDAARPFVSCDLIVRTIEGAIAHGAAIAAVAATDTVKRGNAGGMIVSTLPRTEIFLAQTPQAFMTRVLGDAIARADSSAEASDEARLVEQAGYPVRLIDGDVRNVKITTPEDVRFVHEPPDAPPRLRVGNGYDLHRLVSGRPLVLGGIKIPSDVGLQGFSDADAVCHAVTDALLGAAGAGDIGRHFPDTDPTWKDADSTVLLGQVASIVRRAGFSIVNIDVVVIAERPRLASHVPSMVARLADVLQVAPSQLSIKGKTNEGMDATGTGAAIAVHAVALLLGSGVGSI